MKPPSASRAMNMTTATPVSRRFFLTFPEDAGETWVADWSGDGGAAGVSGLAGAAGVPCAAGVGSSTGVAGAAGRSWVEAAATGADGPAGESSTEAGEAGSGATGSGQDAGAVAARGSGRDAGSVADTGSGSVPTASSCPVSGRGFKGGTGSSTIFLRSETALATSSGVSSWVFRETG